MKKILFKGCGTAISTPFDENGVNFKEFKKLVENQIQNKVDAIIVCGTTGEASTMTTDEKLETIKCAVKTSNGRIPIIAGTGYRTIFHCYLLLYLLRMNCCCKLTHMTGSRQ